MQTKKYENKYGSLNIAIVNTKNGWEIIGTMRSDITGIYSIRISGENYRETIGKVLEYFQTIVKNYQAATC